MGSFRESSGFWGREPAQSIVDAAESPGELVVVADGCALAEEDLEGRLGDQLDSALPSIVVVPKCNRRCVAKSSDFRIVRRTVDRRTGDAGQLRIRREREEGKSFVFRLGLRVLSHLVGEVQEEGGT
jgi:hypothetical protein